MSKLNTGLVQSFLFLLLGRHFCCSLCRSLWFLHYSLSVVLVLLNLPLSVINSLPWLERQWLIKLGQVLDIRKACVSLRFIPGSLLLVELFRGADSLLLLNLPRLLGLLLTLLLIYAMFIWASLIVISRIRIENIPSCESHSDSQVHECRYEEQKVAHDAFGRLWIVQQI